MALLSISGLRVAFGDKPLIDDATLSIQRGEKVCLVGRNGTGKSTLMKIIVGDFIPDAGEIAREKGASFSYLPQDVPEKLNGKIFDVVAEGLKEKGKLLSKYHEISAKLEKHHGDEQLLAQLDAVQLGLERLSAWDLAGEINSAISHMKLDPDLECSEISAGMKRRVLIARALVLKPDLLLLDEPTNHLDIESISWLEDHLKNYSGTILFVTHDRMFLKNLATRIIEIDRGKISSWACGYESYLARKDAALGAEENQRALFEKKLAEEEAWLRQGVRARRTRNEGRVKALYRMREFKRSLRQRMGSIHLEAEEAERSGRLVIEVENASFSYGQKTIIKNFSTTIMRGDKIGIIGPNGSGKTTLLRMLLQDLPLDSGQVRKGTNLQIAYFDQLRDSLDGEKSVQDNICDGNPFLTINGNRKHVIGYLEDFLFSPERSRSPVRILSGGEKNRLMLAKLFTIASNLLVLDEPTNDLDADSLDILEEMLINYSGTVLLVSHDRSFLNNVVTSTIALEGNGVAAEYVGGYDDWLRQRSQPDAKTEIEETNDAGTKKTKPKQPKKISFNEKRELESLPKKIEAMEIEKQALLSSMSDPETYKSKEKIDTIQKKLAELDEQISHAYDLWVELENKNDPKI